MSLRCGEEDGGGDEGDLSLGETRPPDGPSNRIFLNFARNIVDPEADCCRIDKAKKLFRFLWDNEELQEMKALGWQDEDGKKEECDDEEVDEEDDFESNDCCEYDAHDDDDEERRRPRGRGGHRFLMSRDFWYRRLNILKAQKLDEVALETKDMPPKSRSNSVSVAVPKGERILANRVPENQNNVYAEMDDFDHRIAKPVECVLRQRFVNIYNDRLHFCIK